MVTGSDDWQPAAGVEAEPIEELAADDPDALVVVAQPLRSRLTRLLIDRPATVAELADELDVPVTRLYYHLDKLETHGLVQVVATRRVRGVEERRYRATARSYTLSERLMAVAREEPEVFDRVVAALFGGAKAELEGVLGRLDEDRRDQLALMRPVLRLTPERQAELLSRLRELIAEYDDDEGDVELAMLLVAYPLSDRRDGE